MPESEKERYDASNFQTIAKFRKLNNLNKGETEALVKTAARLYRMKKMVKRPSGKYVPWVIINAGSHNTLSKHKINLMITKEFLAEYEKDKAIKTKKAKGAEK